MYICDSHTHTHYSYDVVKDETTDIAAICNSAIKKGISEIVLTDHYELNGDIIGYTPEYEADKAYEEIHRMKLLYKDRLRITYGIEIGQATQRISLATEFIKRYPFEFIIGSLHNLNNVPDFCYMKYDIMPQRECDLLWERYLDEVEELLDFEGFQSLGHFTYPERYLIRYGKEIDYAKYYDKIRAIFRKLVEKGISIEINTSSIRQRTGNTMPSIELIKLYKEVGGELITCGSDSHRADDIGEDVPLVYGYLKEIGYKYITVYRDRKPEMIKLD